MWILVFPGKNVRLTEASCPLTSCLSKVSWVVGVLFANQSFVFLCCFHLVMQLFSLSSLHSTMLNKKEWWFGFSQTLCFFLNLHSGHNWPSETFIKVGRYLVNCYILTFMRIRTLDDMFIINFCRTVNAEQYWSYSGTG